MVDLKKEFEKALFLNEEILQVIYNVEEMEYDDLKSGIQTIINQEVAKSIMFNNLIDNLVCVIPYADFKSIYFDKLINKTVSDKEIEECINELVDYYKQYKVELNIQNNIFGNKSVECVYNRK